jgi:hypothetical protein
MDEQKNLGSSFFCTKYLWGVRSRVKRQTSTSFLSETTVRILAKSGMGEVYTKGSRAELSTCYHTVITSIRILPYSEHLTKHRLEHLYLQHNGTDSWRTFSSPSVEENAQLNMHTSIRNDLITDSFVRKISKVNAIRDIHLSIYLSIYLSICLSIYLSN